MGAGVGGGRPPPPFPEGGGGGRGQPRDIFGAIFKIKFIVIIY